MEQVKVFYDKRGITLTVWFGDSSEEYICKETGGQVILMKGKRGQVIGMEKRSFSIPDHEQSGVAVEVSRYPIPVGH